MYTWTCCGFVSCQGDVGRAGKNVSRKNHHIGTCTDRSGLSPHLRWSACGTPVTIAYPSGRPIHGDSLIALNDEQARWYKGGSMRFRLLLVLFIFVLGFPPAVSAESPPDSGRILQEQKQIPATLPERLPDADDQPLKKESAESGIKITVSGFRFTGAQSVATEAELQQVVSYAVGQELSLTELQNVAAQVTYYLRDKGYFLARAYLPKQEIVDGIVEIAVIAGQVLGEPSVQFSGPVRIREQVISDMASQGVQEGETLQQEKLERAILLMNDLPGISAKSILEKGDAPGTTKVTIEAQEGPLLGGLVSANNFGNRYTGSCQGIAQAAANDLAGIGDQLSLSLTGAEYLIKGAVTYQLPLGNSGLKGSLAYTGLGYELGKEYKSLDVEGTANTFNAALSYPFVRTRKFSLWQAVDYEYRVLADESAGVDISDRNLRVVSLRTTVNSYDQWGGGGLSNIFLMISAGDLSYGLAAEEATDAATANTEGEFHKFAGSLSRLQRLTKDLTLFAAFSGQLASQNLDSSEKFILGGPAGVRAYPVGEASGDQGCSLTAEVRYGVPRQILSSDLQCVAFFDTGRIRLHDSPWLNSVTTATGKNSYNLSGAGFGINFDRPGLFSIRASFAQVIGNNPGRSVDGKNADNKDNDQQVWLQAILWF